MLVQAGGGAVKEPPPPWFFWLLIVVFVAVFGAGYASELIGAYW